MNRFFLGSLLTATLGIAATALVAAQESSAQVPVRRVALLVGIDKYDKRGFDDLHCAERDVEEMEKELIGLHFDKVVTMKGSSKGELRPTKETIKVQLERLLQDVRKTDIVLVMLCGHGQQLKVRTEDGREREDGFYCPINAVLNNPDTMVSLTTLTDDWLAKWGGKNLVLVDACRDGAVDRDRGVRSRGVQGRVVSLPEGTAILFSCSAGQTSIEREDLKHGVFTLSVLEALRADFPNGLVTWTAVVNHVQNRVSELNPEQEPILAGAMGRLVLGRRPFLSSSSSTAAQVHSPVKALIITGDNVGVHRWEDTTEALEEILKKGGRIMVNVTTTPSKDLTDEILAKYDVLVLNYRDTPNGPPETRWSEANKEAFLKAVREGKGLVGYHFASAAFVKPNWEEFEKAISGGWRTQGFHGPAHVFTVTKTDVKHPISEASSAIEHTIDELYQNSMLTPGSEVLATAYSDPRKPRGTGKDEPVIWVNHYGKGRVYQNVLGHDTKAMADPNYQTWMRRGVIWAATGKVD